MYRFLHINHFIYVAKTYFILNLHILNNFRSEKPRASPVIKKLKSGKSAKSTSVEISFDSDSDLEDINCPWESPPPRYKKRNPVLESKDEEQAEMDSQDETDFQDWAESQDGTDSPNSSRIVAEPSFSDLVNMGLGSKGEFSLLLNYNG